ncbi:MAG: TRAP transporter substrate-binding protein DctP [Sulfolobales archaeon]|nr:TRAP transporter substrate-binding protein DctP [Sulfolobales archaeon]
MYGQGQAKVAILVVLIIVAGVGGYFAGSSSAPPRTVTQTVTQTAGAPGTTLTVTQTVTRTTVQTVTQTVTTTAAPTQQVIKWRMPTHAPPADPLTKTAQHFAELVKNASNGRLVIEVYSSGELFPVGQTLDMVSRGAVEIAVTYIAYWVAEDPVFALFSSRPGPLSKPDEVVYYFNSVRDILSKRLETRGVQLIGMLNINPPETVMSSKKPLTSLSDFRGFVIRSIGLSGEFYAALGARPMTMPGPELYQALQLGTIDGAEWGGWLDNYFLGLHEVVKYILEPVAGCSIHADAHVDGIVIVNPSAWRSLPEDLRQVVLTSLKGAFADSIMIDYYANMLAKQEFVKRGITINPIPREDCARVKEIGISLIVSQAKKSADAVEYAKRLIKVYNDLGYSDWASDLEKALKSGGLI